LNLHELLTVASEAIVADIRFFVAPTYDRKLGVGHGALGIGDGAWENWFAFFIIYSESGCLF